MYIYIITINPLHPAPAVPMLPLYLSCSLSLSLSLTVKSVTVARGESGKGERGRGGREEAGEGGKERERETEGGELRRAIEGKIGERERMLTRRMGEGRDI